MRALLFSNSTKSGEEYLSYTLPYINEFSINTSRKAVFIPYAAITVSYNDFLKAVAQKLSVVDISISSIHLSENPYKTLEQASLIIIGGGNTFQLISCLQKLNLLQIIREKVLNNTPYIGWSAGSNVTCPTICTTNDMPVVEPESFNALSLVPFQINPHYTDSVLPNHSGETREMRIREFIEINRQVYVAGLREESMFWIDGNKIQLRGDKSCRIFKFGIEPKEYNPNEDFSFLMQ